MEKKKKGVAAKRDDEDGWRERKREGRKKNLAIMTKLAVVQQQPDCRTSGTHQQVGKSYKKEERMGEEW